MQVKTVSWAMLALTLLAACDTAGGFQASEERLYAPEGRPDGVKSVDGLMVGHRLMEAGEFELALDAYNRAVTERGVNVDVLSAIGTANLRLGRLNQAEQVLRRAVELDETFPPAWNNLGVVLMERGNIGEASRVFRLAFALDSGANPEIRENLVLALAKLDNPEYSAEENYRLVRRGPGHFELRGTEETP